MAIAPTPGSVQFVIPDGQYIADFIATEVPILSQIVATIYNHFGGPLALFVPASVVTGAVKTMFSKLSDAVKNEKLSFSVPSGFIADALKEIEAVVPGILAKIEAELPAEEALVFKALGIL